MGRNHKKPLKDSKRNLEYLEPKTLKSDEQDGYISLSFRYFQNISNQLVQSLADWHGDDILLDLLNSLVYVTQKNVTQLQAGDKKLSLYKGFPNKTVNDFPLPSSLSEKENWGTLRNIGGQKARVAGFLRDNIFYIVYLDKEHKFFKSGKK
ncbi:hypothetical protein [Lonepinella sp. BR2271]|uniref:hypothetical protein n=1 Tax=Lonepinella sp. BR2271 TaxID=3434550 RepID=UPI003F6E3495